jgi:esterase/lipase superfamily enzyme
VDNRFPSVSASCVYRATAALLSILLLVLQTHRVHGQTAAVRVPVAAGATVKSPPIILMAASAVVVRVADADSTGSPFIRVFIHATDGTLVASDDPEQSSEVATFSLAAGSYYAIFRNTGDAAAILTVETERTRGAPRHAELAVVRIFYATDRERLGTTNISYGREPAGMLSYGHADVTLPRAAHQMGELEGPSIWRLEFAADPAKHVIMQPPVAETDQAFLSAVKERVKGSARRECLVFVHGYNVSFEDAVRRTGQITYDLGFDGAPILFSWPSQGSALPANYRKDERNAALSANSLRQLFSSLASQIPGLTIHVVAHSMGSRVVAEALQQLAAEPQRTRVKPVREVALLAPDIDAELFRRAAGTLAGVAEHLTLYASDNDAALALSQRNAGYKRAGQAGPDLVIVPGVDTIDATQVETSVLGLRHLYYADNSTILSDLFHLLRGRSPAERGARLEPAGTPPNTFWRFRPAAR